MPKKYLIIFLSVLLLFLKINTASASTWYISPTGNDSSNGSSTSTPVKTLNKAWSLVQRGDTLMLMDGTYTPNTTGVMSVNVPADDGRRIYIKAQNVGKAVIDGQNQVQPVVHFMFWQGGKNIELEGIVAKNAGSDANLTSAVIKFDTGKTTNANILLKKVGAYNADKDSNSGVIIFYQSSGITVEDCIAGGSGRKMILLYQSSNNTVRRCMVRWLKFDGAKFCGGLSWPAGSGMEIYYGNNNIFENNIGFGNVAYYHFAVKGYDIADGNQAYDNKLVGNMSLFTGKYADGIKVDWTKETPSSTLCSSTNMTSDGVMNAYQTVGLGGPENTAYIANNIWQDNLAYKGGGLAMNGDYYGKGWGNNIMNRITFFGNGDLTSSKADVVNRDYVNYTVSNSYISKIVGASISSLNTGKAKLQNRYIDGVLQDGTNGTQNQSLWPWSMEDQVKYQFATHLAPLYGSANPDLYDFSVTQRVCENVLKGDANISAVSDCYVGGPVPSYPPVPSVSSIPSTMPSISPTVSVQTIPAKIEAESYTSSFGGFQIVSNSTASGGKRLGYLSNGSSFTYKVRTVSSASYNFAFATSTDNTAVPKKLSLYVDTESTPRGIVDITPVNNCTNCWDQYKEHTIPNINLTLGTHDIKVVITNAYYDFDYINITSSTQLPSPTSIPSINPIFDVNSDGKVNLLDVIAILNELFK